MGLRENLESSLADLVLKSMPKVLGVWNGEGGRGRDDTIHKIVAREILQYSDVRYEHGGDLADKSGERLFDEAHLKGLLVAAEDAMGNGAYDPKNIYHFNYKVYRDQFIESTRVIRKMYWESLYKEQNALQQEREKVF